MNLRVLGKNILFKFVQKVSDGKFQSKTDWNFEIKASTDDPKFARWGEVTGVGPDVADVKIGDYVLIEPLMWTNHMSLDDDSDKFWGTNRDKVLAVSAELPAGLI